MGSTNLCSLCPDFFSFSFLPSFSPSLPLFFFFFLPLSFMPFQRDLITLHLINLLSILHNAISQELDIWDPVLHISFYGETNILPKANNNWIVRLCGCGLPFGRFQGYRNNIQLWSETCSYTPSSKHMSATVYYMNLFNHISRAFTTDRILLWTLDTWYFIFLSNLCWGPHDVTHSTEEEVFNNLPVAGWIVRGGAVLLVILLHWCGPKFAG